MSSGDDRLATVERNYRRALERVAESVRLCGRSASDIRIIGVTKYVDAQRTRELYQAGCRALGESRPQSLWSKHADLVDCPDIEWHLIGHLQRNKVARTVALCDWLHSLDSLRLAEALQLEAEKLGKRFKVLLEVNVTEDAEKTGLPIDELPAISEQISALPNLDLRGLMAMSSLHADPLATRREFALVRTTRDLLQERLGGAASLSELSMGMSDDFEAAIAEGATMVRLGSILWEGLDR